MSPTLDGLFQEIRRFAPAGLIDSSLLDSISRLNTRFPEALTSTGGFEIPLNAAESVADWQWCIRAGDRGREALAGEKMQAQLSAVGGDKNSWREICELALAWADPQSLLYGQVDRLWLEFDRQSFDDAAPVPSVFVSIHTQSDSPARPGMALNVALLALRYLNGGPLDPRIETSLKSGLELLPSGAIPAYVALMLSRGTSAVRLVVALPDETLLFYLRQIGWAGAEAELVQFISAVGPLVDRFFYNLDFSETVLPKIGVECHLRNKMTATEPRWEALLGVLVRSGLCLPQKSAALLAWPGHSRMVLPGDPAPAYLFRGLHHLKAVIQPDALTQTKGYFNVWKRSLFEIE